jgi:hypothetical protein
VCDKRRIAKPPLPCKTLLRSLCRAHR